MNILSRKDAETQRFELRYFIVYNILYYEV